MKLYKNLISSITTHEKACSYNLFLKYFYLSFFFYHFRYGPQKYLRLHISALTTNTLSFDAVRNINEEIQNHQVFMNPNNR